MTQLRWFLTLHLLAIWTLYQLANLAGEGQAMPPVPAPPPPVSSATAPEPAPAVAQATTPGVETR